MGPKPYSIDGAAEQVKMWRRAPWERASCLSGAMQAGGLREGVRVLYVPQFSQDGQATASSFVRATSVVMH